MLPPLNHILRHAEWINLDRRAESAAALALVATVTTFIEPHLDRSRPLGATGRATLRKDVGVVLAGALRPGLADSAVRAHASSSGGVWQQSGAIGFRRFWRVARAMIAAGLLDIRPGVRAADGSFGGAAAVWPTPALARLAEEHGATVATRGLDWLADAGLIPAPAGLPLDQLATVRPLQGVPCGAIPAADLAAVRHELAAINAVNEAADIRGAGHTVSLVRRFRHSLAFGGRAYAPVANLSEVERLRVTFGGAPAAEVDLRAAQLSLLIGMSGQPLPLDPYAISGVPRAAVKRFTVATIGAGRPLRAWPLPGDTAALGVSIREVAAAVVARYPFLDALPALVPSALLDDLPAERHAWAAGQWLTAREAAIVGAALSSVTGRNIPALPIHDALLVPAHAADLAADAMAAAFTGFAGSTPGLTITTADKAARAWAADQRAA